MHTIRTLLFSFLLCLLPLFARGQQVDAANQPGSNEVTIQESDVWGDILQELKDIKTIQDSTYQQRMRAIEARKAGEKDHERSEFGVMSEVEKNTRYDFWGNDVNLIGIVALFIAIISLVVAVLTFLEQSKTEKHTQKAPMKAQLGVLKDLPRHFYRNLACTCASHIKYRSQTPTSGGLRQKYPSEANILKLSTLPDEFILPIDSGSDPIYRKMHEEKLLFKNYNLEVEVAAKHFAIKGITDTSLTNDYDNLLFKPVFLITRMLEFQDMIIKDEQDDYINGVVYAIYAFVKEHFEKLGFKAFIDNYDKEISFITSIVKDKVFVSLIGVKDDSIERSLKMLLKYGKSNADDDFLDRPRNDKGEYTGKGTINKERFVAFFKQWYEAEALDKKTKGLDALNNVLEVHSVDDFSNRFNDGEMNPNVMTAYDALKFYFDFMQNDEWVVKDLLFTILKVDAILEISKIGMIEY